MKKAAEDHKKSLKSTERRIKDLETWIDKEGRASSETGLLQKRITQELEDEREQHRKDVSERDLMVEQARKTHQGETDFLNFFSLVGDTCSVCSRDGQTERRYRIISCLLLVQTQTLPPRAPNISRFG